MVQGVVCSSQITPTVENEGVRLLLTPFFLLRYVHWLLQIRFLHLAIIVLSLVSPVFGQSTSPQSTQQEKRIALVIGNGNYIGSTLANPENDAKAMRVALQSVGFTVMEYENLNQVQMKKAIDEFGTTCT
jgi:hypothetical protein